MSATYDASADLIIQMLIAEATAAQEVIGLVLMGSRAIGAASAESDYDLLVVLSDEALARYAQEQRTPAYAESIRASVGEADIATTSPQHLRLDTVRDWMLPAYAGCQILFDRTGEAARLIDALRRMPEENLQVAIAGRYDAYLNGVYRSLKCWRRSNELGARMEAAQVADYLLHLLFALEGHWRPYSSRLPFHLGKLAGQGWQEGELDEILLDLITTGNPTRQQNLTRRIAALLSERGFDQVYADWEGEIDRVLEWEFG